MERVLLRNPILVSCISIYYILLYISKCYYILVLYITLKSIYYIGNIFILYYPLAPPPRLGAKEAHAEAQAALIFKAGRDKDVLRSGV